MKLKDIERKLTRTLLREYGATWDEYAGLYRGEERELGRHVKVEFPLQMLVTKRTKEEVRNMFDESYDTVRITKSVGHILYLIF